MQQHQLSLDELLKQGDALPTLPEIYTRVSTQLDDIDTSVDDIGQTVSTDPAISYKILTMVNSAYYGLPNEISSISQAIALIGRFRLKQILIGALLGDVFKGLDSQHFSLKNFWEHSIRTAIIAKQLVINSDYGEEPETIFTAGLLHDVGRLILAAQKPEVLADIDRHSVLNHVEIAQAEIDITGLSHTEIGGALMQKWDFPDIIWVCVLNHHRTDYRGPFFNAAQFIYLANQLAHHETPNDEDETETILKQIANWRDAEVSVISVFNACRVAEDMVFDVMKSLGMQGK